MTMEHITDEEKWEKAIKRASSYHTRFSTVQSKLFWSTWEHPKNTKNGDNLENNYSNNCNNCNNNTFWKDLPNQIIQLKDNYLHAIEVSKLFWVLIIL